VKGSGDMTIVITLSPELETLLLNRATRQGQEVNLVASELLEGIQRGLDDFEVGQFRDFQEFAEEQRLKYNLPADS
jgi:hypothetical protein